MTAPWYRQKNITEIAASLRTALGFGTAADQDVEDFATPDDLSALETSVNDAIAAAVLNKVSTSRVIGTGTGLEGGGDLSDNRTLTVDIADATERAAGAPGKIIDAAGLAAELNGFSSSMLELVETANITSAVASVDFVGLSDSIYSHYLFVFDMVTCSVAAQGLLMRTSTNNGTSFDSGGSDYKQSGTVVVGNAYNFMTGGAAVSVTGLASDGLATSEGMCGELRLFGAGRTVKARGTLHSVYLRGYDSLMAAVTGSFTRDIATAVNAVRFLFASGNITSGKIRCYGIRK